MNKSQTFPLENASISKAVDFAASCMDEAKIAGKERAAALLKFENALEGIIRKSSSAADTLTVTAVRLPHKLILIIRYHGEKVSMQEIVPDMGLDDTDPEAAEIIKEKMLPILSRDIRSTSHHGVNRIVIDVSRKKLSRIAFNFLCVAIGILLGLLVKNVLPASASSFIATEVLGTVITAFFNLLKMIVAPLVFFSILTGISGFDDARELGKISFKTIVYFVVFSIIGLFIGLGVYAVLPSGSPEIMQLASFDTAKVTTTVGAWEALKTLFSAFFPSNLLGAFVNNEILSVIFLAILFGLCIGKLKSDYADPLNRAADVMNEVMCRLATMIVSVMPFIIICSMAQMMINVEFSSAVVLLKLLLSFLVGVLIMMLVYCAVLALNGISPAVFFKGYAPAILSGVTLASSSATVPVSLKCCTDNLKIPPMITYFVVPLGSTINMNGSCILLTLICLFTAKVFGIVPTASMMLPVLCMILLLSMAAPGVPGSLIIMLASILPMLGIPSEAAQLSICISPFVGMLLVPINCTGDAVTAMLIHRGRQKKAK